TCPAELDGGLIRLSISTPVTSAANTGKLRQRQSGKFFRRLTFASDRADLAAPVSTRATVADAAPARAPVATRARPSRISRRFFVAMATCRTVMRGAGHRASCAPLVLALTWARHRAP